MVLLMLLSLSLMRGGSSFYAKVRTRRWLRFALCVVAMKRLEMLRVVRFGVIDIEIIY